MFFLQNIIKKTVVLKQILWQGIFYEKIPRELNLGSIFILLKSPNLGEKMKNSDLFRRGGIYWVCGLSLKWFITRRLCCPSTALKPLLPNFLIDIIRLIRKMGGKKKVGRMKKRPLFQKPKKWGISKKKRAQNGEIKNPANF